MKESLENYTKYLQSNGRTENTIKAYIGSLEKFFAFNDVEVINEDNVREFISQAQEKYSTSTVNLYKNSISSFLKFLGKEIRLPKTSKCRKKLPKVISEKQFKEDIIPVVEGFFESCLKYKTILYFMFYTGIRVGEIELLNREDFDLKERIVKIYSEKTKEERMVFYSSEVSRLLIGYFSTEIETKNAFNITTSGIQSFFKRLNDLINIKIYPHLLRHSFSVMTLMKGASLPVLSQLLGHKNLATTMIYSGFQTSQLKQIYDKIYK